MSTSARGSVGSSSLAFCACTSAAARSLSRRSTAASSRYRNGLCGEPAIASSYALRASLSRPLSAACLAAVTACCALWNRSTSTRLLSAPRSGSAPSAASKLLSASSFSPRARSASPRPTSAGAYRGLSTIARSKCMSASSYAFRASWL